MSIIILVHRTETNKWPLTAYTHRVHSLGGCLARQTHHFNKLQICCYEMKLPEDLGISIIGRFRLRPQFDSRDSLGHNHIESYITSIYMVGGCIKVWLTLYFKNKDSKIVISRIGIACNNIKGLHMCIRRQVRKIFQGVWGLHPNVPFPPRKRGRSKSYC